MGADKEPSNNSRVDDGRRNAAFGLASVGISAIAYVLLPGSGGTQEIGEHETGIPSTKSLRLRRRPVDPPYGPTDPNVDNTWKRREAAYADFARAEQSGLEGMALDEYGLKLSRAQFEHGTVLREYERIHGHATYPGQMVTEEFDQLDRRIRARAMTDDEIVKAIDDFVEPKPAIDRYDLRGYLCGYYGACQVQ